MTTKRRISALTGVMLSLAGVALTAFIPARAQTLILPESTPEFWPLTLDPASVVIDPAAFTLIFEAPRTCAVSPDESALVLDGVGIYDLASGQKRFGIDGGALGFSPVAPLVQISGGGVVDFTTGQRVIETQHNSGIFSDDGRWFVDYNTVYDLQTAQPVAQIERSGDGNRSYSYAGFERGGRWLRYASQSDLVALRTANWQPVFDPVIYTSLVQRQGAASAIYYTLLAVGGDGVYDLVSGEKRFDLGAADKLRFSGNGSVLTAAMPDGIVMLDTRDGSEMRRFDVPAADFTLSPDGRTLLVPQYSEVHADGQILYIPLRTLVFDVASGQQRATIAAAGETAFLPDQRFIRIHDEGVFDVTTGVRLAVLARGQSATMTADGRVAFIYDDNTITVSDPQSWTPRFRVTGDLASVSPDRRWLMAGGTGVYNLETGRLVLATPGLSLRFSADGHLLVSTVKRRCAVYRVPEN